MKALLKEVANRRQMIMYHFSKVGKYLKDNIADVTSGPVTRSMANDDKDDWVVDMDAANCNVTAPRSVPNQAHTHASEEHEVASTRQHRGRHKTVAQQGG